VVACHIAVRDADHSIARGLEDCRTRGIIRPSFTSRVRCALKLEHQPLGGATNAAPRVAFPRHAGAERPVLVKDDIRLL
jgi:hypothetical protein